MEACSVYLKTEQTEHDALSALWAGADEAGHPGCCRESTPSMKDFLGM